jgi:hypothetical protein
VKEYPEEKVTRILLKKLINIDDDGAIELKELVESLDADKQNNSDESDIEIKPVMKRRSNTISVF